MPRPLLVALAAAGCSGPPPTPAPAPASTDPAPTNSAGRIDRLDAALDQLIAANAVIEKVAGGFKFTEGPLWRPDGTLWFSDVQGNVVRSVTPDGKVSVIIENAGGVSKAPADSFIGPNGMVEASDGSVWMVQHGDRQIVRIASDRTMTSVVSKFEGKHHDPSAHCTRLRAGHRARGRGRRQSAVIYR